MTNEEAIDLLSEITMYCDFTDEYGDYINDEPYITALDMAIKALETELLTDTEQRIFLTAERRYDTLFSDNILSVADVFNAIISDLKGTSIDGYMNAPTIIEADTEGGVANDC